MTEVTASLRAKIGLAHRGNRQLQRFSHDDLPFKKQQCRARNRARRETYTAGILHLDHSPGPKPEVT